MQAMMGVDEPDYGHLLDTVELREDTPVPVAAYCAPRIEAEALPLGPTVRITYG
ncbi:MULTISPECIES: hypothetical protein [Streptomyces]|uniref:hypothetical protein n=1 Tax=Streptomyces TaxID=1883 RepID=UPI0036B45148